MSDTRLRPVFTGFLAEIAEAAGDAVALKFAAHCGGGRVDIPARPGPDHWLVKLLGEKDATKVCDYLSVVDADRRLTGVRHEVVPLGPVAYYNVARQLVLDELRKSGNVRKAARAACVHERTVWRYRAQFRKLGLLP